VEDLVAVGILGLETLVLVALRAEELEEVQHLQPYSLLNQQLLELLK
jgi:hypothetical protein